MSNTASHYGTSKKVTEMMSNTESENEVNWKKKKNATNGQCVEDLENLSDKNSSSTGIPSHLFVELTSLDELSFPTSSSARIKYTCLSGSAHYLAVGTSSGTVYLFSRYAARYRKSLSSVPVQVIVSKQGWVGRLLMSPNEKHLAVASKRGHVYVSSLGGAAPVTALNNSLHIGAAVSALLWSEDSHKLYAADLRGLITCSRLSSRALFRTACEVLVRVDSCVVQMDICGQMLLISTTTRCYLHNLTRSNQVQIGKKLRNGPYGALFFPVEKAEYPIILAGRPNGRLWKADSQGNVYRTHQFSQIADVPSTPLVSYRSEFEPTTVETSPVTESVNFGCCMHLLTVANEKFLLTIKDRKFCVFEPLKARMVLVCDLQTSISQYSVCGGDVFFLSENGNSPRKVSLFSLEKAIEKLQLRHCYKQAAHILLSYGRKLLEQKLEIPCKRDVLADIVENYSSIDGIASEKVSRLNELLDVAKCKSEAGGDRAKVARLSTGVHRVVRIMENSGYDDDFTFRAPSPLTRHRSRSSPNIDETLLNNAADGKDEKGHWKRLSVPHRACSEEKRHHVNGRIVKPVIGGKHNMNNRSKSEESLRTLLDALNSHRQISFDSELTLKAIPKDLNDQKKLGDFVLPEIVSDQRLFLSPLTLGTGRLEGHHDDSRLFYGTTILKKFGRTMVGAGRKETNISYPLEKVEVDPVLDNTGNKRAPLAQMPQIPLVKRRNLQQQNKSARSRRLQNANVCSLNAVNQTKRQVSGRQRPLSYQDSNSYETKVSEEDEEEEEEKEINEANDHIIESVENSVDFDGTFDRCPRSATVLPTFCPKCSLHKSWIELLQVCNYVTVVSVSPDHFLQDGVPASLKQWTDFFHYRLSAEKSATQQPTASLCETCSIAFDNICTDLLESAVEEDGDRDDRFVKENVSSLKQNTDGDITELAAAVSNEQILAVLKTDSEETCSTQNETSSRLLAKSEDMTPSDILAYSTYANPAYESIIETSTEQKRFAWAASLPLAVLCLIMAKVLGSETVLDMLETDIDLLTSLTVSSDWQLLARMRQKQQNVGTVENPQLLDALFRDLFEDECTLLRYSTANGSSDTANPGFILAIDSQCPCCTLPLHTRVSETRGQLTVFNCGHAYHSVCLGSSDKDFVCVQCQKITSTNFVV